MTVATAEYGRPGRPHCRLRRDRPVHLSERTHCSSSAPAGDHAGSGCRPSSSAEEGIIELRSVRGHPKPSEIVSGRVLPPRNACLKRRSRQSSRGASPRRCRRSASQRIDCEPDGSQSQCCHRLKCSDWVIFHTTALEGPSCVLYRGSRRHMSEAST